jgi:DNA-binding transcriptional MerR regulator
MSKKETYGIGEASTITGVSQRKLRDWEEKKFIEPERIVCGDRSYRRYNRKDIDLIKRIKGLQNQGFTLRSAVQQVRGE